MIVRFRREAPRARKRFHKLEVSIRVSSKKSLRVAKKGLTSKASRRNSTIKGRVV